MPSMPWPFPVIFQVDSYWRPPRGQKSQHSEQPVHIFTSVGRSSSPIPIESVGHAATHTPHCTQRSASMTAFSRSQNQTFPGASSMSFIISRMSKPATLLPPDRHRRATPQGVPELAVLFAAGPLVEALAVAALLLEPLEDAHQGVGDLLGGPRALDPVYERRVPAQGTAEADVHALDDGVLRLRGLAAEADVPDLGLRAGRRATREVHPDGLLPDIADPLVHLLRPLDRPDLGLHDREPTELVPGARHDPTLESPRSRRKPLQQRLGQQPVEALLRHAADDEVLVGGEPHALAVLLRQPRRLDEVLAAHAPYRHVQADVVEAVFLLLVDADVIAPVTLRQVLARRRELERGAILQLLAEAFGAELLHEVTKPIRPAVLAVAELAEDLGDGARYLYGLLGPDKHVHVRGHARAVREAAADAQVEAHGTVFEARGEQADVVDLGLPAIFQTPRHAHLELARQVRVLAVAGEVVRDGLSDRIRVEKLLSVEAGDGAAQDVAGGVAAGLNGGHADGFEPAPYLGDLALVDPVHLAVLA